MTELFASVNLIAFFAEMLCFVFRIENVLKIYRVLRRGQGVAEKILSIARGPFNICGT